VSTEPTVYRVLLLVVHEVQICGQTHVLATGTMMYSVMSVVQSIAQPKLLCSNGGEAAVSHMIAGSRNALSNTIGKWWNVLLTVLDLDCTDVSFFE